MDTTDRRSCIDSSDQPSEGTRVVLGDPARECHVEDGDAHLGGEGRRPLRCTTLDQRILNVPGQSLELDQLTFLQLRGVR